MRFSIAMLVFRWHFYYTPKKLLQQAIQDVFRGSRKVVGWISVGSMKCWSLQGSKAWLVDLYMYETNYSAYSYTCWYYLFFWNRPYVFQIPISLSAIVSLSAYHHCLMWVSASAAWSISTTSSWPNNPTILVSGHPHPNGGPGMLAAGGMHPVSGRWSRNMLHMQQ